MYSVSFMANETAGSIGERRIGATKGESAGSVGEKPETSKGETAGSIGFRGKSEQLPELLSSPQTDTVCFRGRNGYEQDKSSVVGKIFGIAIAAASVIAALGYAHKVDAVGKLSEGRFKDFMRKSDSITKPCHDWCHGIKDFCTKHYSEIKQRFNKK